jgi:beta-aspartyl-peptidase (threonine type)
VLQHVSAGLEPAAACSAALSETLDLPDDFRAPLQALCLLPDGRHGGAATRAGATYSVMSADDETFQILERATL